MITFEGTEAVSDVETKSGNNGEWAIIRFANGLQAATFSDSSIHAAEQACSNKVPLAFTGIIKTKEWNEKVFPNFQIEYAWVKKSVTKASHDEKIAAARAANPPVKPPEPIIQKEAEDEEDLPF